MNKSTPIVFFGSDDFSLPALRALHRSYPIESVVTRDISATTRKHVENPVQDFAKEHNLPFGNLSQLPIQPKARIAVLASYGQILTQEVIDRFDGGIINVHPSMLPELRGPSPIEQAILLGLDSTGVSIIKLVAAMDAGPIYAQLRVELNGHETQMSLRQQLAELGARLLMDTLPRIIDGSAAPEPQDDSSATYTTKLSKRDGQVKWNSPAIEIERKIRAFQSWPKATAELDGHQVQLLAAEVLNPANTKPQDPGTIDTADGLRVVCAHKVLKILRLKPAGKNEMSGEDFIRGYLRR